MIEWYCNRTVCFQVGQHIFATYGIFLACMGAFFLAVANGYTVGWMGVAPHDMCVPRISADMVSWVMVAVIFGYRVCSMFLEDTHEIARGNIVRAFLRPGFLEAGGHTALTVCACALGAYECGTDVRGILLVTDILNMAYYSSFWLLSLGCVTYGCCWGKPLTHPSLFATVYTSPLSKVGRVRPDLLGKPLFPHATVRAALFAKNAIALSLLGAIYYVPGLFTAIFPVLNNYDKGLYYDLRGDCCPQMQGFCKSENFYMVAPEEKKDHCMRWSYPDRVVGCLSMVAVCAHALQSSGVSFLPDAAALAGAGVSVSAALLATSVPAIAFGYHYKRLGVWICKDP